MDEQLFGFISGIVSGIVTNGIQGVYHYITKETLEDCIAGAIESVQSLYEKEFDLNGKSLFIWQKNIEYYAGWLQEGFLPREKIAPPIPYDIDKLRRVEQKEINFIYEKRRNMKLRTNIFLAM